MRLRRWLGVLFAAAAVLTAGCVPAETAARTETPEAASFAEEAGASSFIEEAGAVSFAEEAAVSSDGETGGAASAESAAEDAAMPGVYQIGDVVKDFTVLLEDGQQVSLYGLLEDHDAVFLNFFATWCMPCHMEYPYLNEAAAEYEDVAVLAVSADPSDTAEALLEEREKYGLGFMTAQCSYDLDIAFSVQAVPTSFMIDRRKVLCWTQTSAFQSAAPLKMLFHAFSADDYGDSLTDYVIPPATPEVAGAEALSGEELSRLLCAGKGDLAFTNSEDPAVFPFVASEDGGVRPSNFGCPGTTAECRCVLEAGKGDVLAFTWEMNGSVVLENAALLVDGETVKSITGVKERSGYAYTFEKAGRHEVAFDFVVNAFDSPSEDYFMTIRDVRLLSGKEAEEALAALPVWPAVLTGDACELTVSGGKAKEVIVSPAEGEELSYRRYYIAGGTDAEVHISIGPETDPDNTILMLVSKEYGYRCLSEFETDESGFVVPLRLMKEDPDGYPYNIVQVLVNGGVTYGPGAVFCADEANMDATIPYLTDSKEAGWTYAGTEASSSPDSAEEPASPPDSAEETASPDSAGEPAL